MFIEYTIHKPHLQYQVSLKSLKILTHEFLLVFSRFAELVLSF